EILGVRSSFTARLDTFKNEALTSTTAARGRSLLAALHSVAKPSRGRPAPHRRRDCPLLLGIGDCPHYRPITGSSRRSGGTRFRRFRGRRDRRGGAVAGAPVAVSGRG